MVFKLLFFFKIEKSEEIVCFPVRTSVVQLAYWKQVGDVGWYKTSFSKMSMFWERNHWTTFTRLVKTMWLWLWLQCWNWSSFCFAVKRSQHSVLCVQWSLSSNSTPSEETMSLTCQKASVSCEEDKIWPCWKSANCWMWRRFSLYLGNWNR